MKQAELLEDDVIQEDTKVTTSDLTHRLYRRFDTSEDAMIIGNWQSANYEIQGFEIKVSRSDWLNEVKEPSKALATKKYCDRWWLLIASEGMYKLDEIPEDWGVMVAHGTGIRVIRKAPLLTPQPLTVQFITGLLRANKRGHVPEDVHAQYIADNNRATEAKLRKEFDELKEFVKVIKDTLGIELKQEKRWNVSLQQDDRYWVAKVRNKWSNYTPEQLKALLEAALTEDYGKVQNDLRGAYDDLQRAMITLKKYEGKIY